MEDTSEHLDLEDIILQAPSMAAICEVYRDIQRIRQSCKDRQTRSFHGKEQEFWDVIGRLERGEAQLALRKLFTIGGPCNLMEEIWIRDKDNQLAKTNPMKEYTVVHVHYHERWSRKGLMQKITLVDPYVVDAMNARHIQNVDKNTRDELCDNPFKGTAIEAHSMKLHPAKNVTTWTCKNCNPPHCNPLHDSDCTNCKGKSLRPCSDWNWNFATQSHKHPRLAALLRTARAQVKLWISGGARDTATRSPDEQTASQHAQKPENTYSLREVMQSVQASHRVQGIFIGINKYDHISTLKNCVNDAKLLCTRTKDAAIGDVFVMPDTFDSHMDHVAFLKLERDFLRQQHSQKPHIFLFYFAGHGMSTDKAEYMLMSDFIHGEDKGPSFELKCSCVNIFNFVKEICSHVNDNNSETEKYFFFDMCRTPNMQNQKPPPMEVPLNTVIVFATQPGQVAFDAPDNGNPETCSNSPFCSALAQHLFEPNENLCMLVWKSIRAATRGSGTRPERKGDITNPDEILRKLNSDRTTGPLDQLEVVGRDYLGSSTLQESAASMEDVSMSQAATGVCKNSTSQSDAQESIAALRVAHALNEGQGFMLQSLGAVPSKGAPHTPEVLVAAQLETEGDVHSSVVPDDTKFSRCKMGLTKLAKLTSDMARDLYSNHFHAFMDLLDASCEDEEAFDVTESGLERFFLPGHTDTPIQDLASAEPHVADLPKVWEEMNCSAVSDDVDCQKTAYLEMTHEWSQPETISTYSKSDDISQADSLCAKVDSVMNFFMNRFCVDIRRDFEYAGRKQAQQEMNTCIDDCKSETLARFGMFAGADVRKCIGDELLQEATAESISPSLEMGKEEIRRVERFAKYTENSSLPYIFSKELYLATSFVAVLGSTRFGAWLLFKLLTEYIEFRRHVWNLDFRLFLFEGAGLVLCLCEAGNVLKFRVLGREGRAGPLHHVNARESQPGERDAASDGQNMSESGKNLNKCMYVCM